MFLIDLSKNRHPTDLSVFSSFCLLSTNLSRVDWPIHAFTWFLIRQLTVVPTSNILTLTRNRKTRRHQATRTRAQHAPTTHRPLRDEALLAGPEDTRTRARLRPEAAQADTLTRRPDPDHTELAIHLSEFKCVIWDQCLMMMTHIELLTNSKVCT